MSKQYQTSDGKKFYTENLAKNYAKDLEDKKVTPIEASAVKKNTEETKGSSGPETVDVVLAQAAELQTVEEVQALLDAEKALKRPRKTAIEGLKARLAELSND